MGVEGKIRSIREIPINPWETFINTGNIMGIEKNRYKKFKVRLRPGTSKMYMVSSRFESESVYIF